MTDDYTDELRHGGGAAFCPRCDWWVPEGMEYLYPDHRAECILTVGDYYVRCVCGAVASWAALDDAREWAGEHAAACEYPSPDERDVTIFEVVERLQETDDDR